MLRLSRPVLLSLAGLTYSVPAFAHPGHGPDNHVLHRLLHFAGGIDPVPAALGVGVLALTLAVAFLMRSRRARQR